MSKFCMFCGNQIPDFAQFCPACGKAQEAPTQSAPTSKPKQEDDGSDELNLLSQFGFISQKPKKTQAPFQPTNQGGNVEQSEKDPEIQSDFINIEKQKQQTPNITHYAEKQKPIKEHAPYKDDDIREGDQDSQEEVVSQPILHQQPQRRRSARIRENSQIPEHQYVDVAQTKQEIVVPKENESSVMQVESESQPIQRQQRTRRPHRSQNNPAPFTPTETKQENIMPTESTSEEKYELPENFSISEQDDASSDDGLTLEEMLKIQEEEEKIKREQEKKNRQAAIAASKAKRLSNARKQARRELSEEDEEEDFSSELSDLSGGFSKMSSGTLYADEVADEKRRNSSSENDDDDDDVAQEETHARRRTGEGRKSTPAAKRRGSARNADINKKVYNIEQDISQLDPEERNYDGYYENVLPIDIDDQQKNKIDFKRILILVGGIAFVALIIFITFKVMQSMR